MQRLHDFFRRLDAFILDALDYMLDGLLGSGEYREGFAAGIVVLFVLGGLSLLLPYAWRRILIFFGPRPPSLTPGVPPAQLGSGCLWGTFILIVLTLLGLGMLWGLF